ncbi:hypothetical protein L7F22_047364 [Adiantum nelumboides]|nr:hypothetical protein [Adiantum nelumboides]
MTSHALGIGLWIIGNSTLCLFKWHKSFSPEKSAMEHFPIWVEFPNLPLEYGEHLKVIGSKLGRVLGGRPRRDYNPSWNPQGLIEMNIEKQLPFAMDICTDDGEEFEQQILYKYLPSACFHCGVKGHFIKDCPILYPKVETSPSGAQTLNHSLACESSPTPRRTSLPTCQQTKTSETLVSPKKTNGGKSNRAKSSKKTANRYIVLPQMADWELSEVADSQSESTEEESIRLYLPKSMPSTK